MPSNDAAWLKRVKSTLEVEAAPYTPPGEHEIVIKNGAIAINPIDWIAQESGDMVYPWVKYPFILGTDIAGEVVEVGSGVSRFKPGDRVVSHAVGANKAFNTPAKGAFQSYTVAVPHMTSPIPSSMSFESACVLPLGLSTAACGLFEKNLLALVHPPASGKATPTGSTLVIWGGASSVGSNAIQLAVASGYTVITTCSPQNFTYVKNLGASQAFDYRSPTVVTDIVSALKNKKVAGAMSIGQGAAEACLDVLQHCHGNKFLAFASYPTPPVPFTRLVALRTIWYIGSRVLSWWYTAWARGIRNKFVLGDTLIQDEVGKLIYEDYLPAALEASTFVTAPEPLVVGHGLESVQKGFDVQKKGVSAKKVVITL